MIIPKIEPPAPEQLKDEAARDFIVEAFKELVEDQGESGLAFSLMIAELTDCRYVHGFLIAYACIRRALINRETEKLEEMFRCPNP